MRSKDKKSARSDGPTLSSPRQRARKPPPKVSRGYLMRAVEHYLARYGAPRAHVRRLMMRRVDRSLAVHGGSREEAAQLLDEVLDKMAAVGALDDERYARAQVESLRRRGMSTLAIRTRLGGRGVDAAIVSDRLEAEADAAPRDADPDLQAACAWMRKRRMGAYRNDPQERAAMRDKDLARLARKGFSFDVARRALALETVDEVDALGVFDMTWT